MILVLHNVTSTQRLIDTARIAFDNDAMFVVTKPGGTAAQAGIPEVSKLAYRMGKPFLVLPELKDAIELLSPEKVFLISNSGRKLTGDDLKGKVMVVLPGTESGFTKFELTLGEQVSVTDGKVSENNPVVSASLLFYCLRKT